MGGKLKDDLDRILTDAPKLLSGGLLLPPGTREVLTTQCDRYHLIELRRCFLVPGEFRWIDYVEDIYDAVHNIVLATDMVSPLLQLADWAG